MIAKVLVEGWRLKGLRIIKPERKLNVLCLYQFTKCKQLQAAKLYLLYVQINKHIRTFSALLLSSHQ